MINDRDNNATLFGEAQPGESVSIVRENGDLVQKVKAGQRIPVGHKIALREIPKGERVIKYGETIGVTTMNIQEGDHVHVHNVVGLAFPGTPTSTGSKPA